MRQLARGQCHNVHLPRARHTLTTKTLTTKTLMAKTAHRRRYRHRYALSPPPSAVREPPTGAVFFLPGGSVLDGGHCSPGAGRDHLLHARVPYPAMDAATDSVPHMAKKLRTRPRGRAPLSSCERDGVRLEMKWDHEAEKWVEPLSPPQPPTDAGAEVRPRRVRDARGACARNGTLTLT